MTMNSTGQISLGGSTVGQSINLEILQSATASVSLNTSAVRALAVVPTGAISIGDVYGKTYTRYGTATGSFNRSTATATITISAGQPNAAFYIYAYYTTSGQAYPGYIAPDPVNYPSRAYGYLDSNGNYSHDFVVGFSDPYWYPGPYTNYYYIYQGSVGPYANGTRIGSLALSS
jgi:hypothetical protein